MEKQKNEVLTDCSKFLKCMIFSKKHSKIKNIFSLKAWKKKRSGPSFWALFLEKTFFFLLKKTFFLVGGRAPFRSTPPCRQPKKNFFQQKKNLFLEQRSKLGPLLFFFPTFKEPSILTFYRFFFSKFDKKNLFQNKAKIVVFFFSFHF